MIIKDFWDHRLSTCTPLIVRESGTWVCQVWRKDGTNPTPEEEFDTELPFVAGDEHDEEKLRVCHDWFRSVRDKYAVDNIDDLKPHVIEWRRREDADAEIRRAALN